MRPVWIARLLCFAIAVQFLATPAWAYRRESRIPLVGCRGHYAASGSARYFAVRNEPREEDREKVVIEIHNVPLKPGTVLVIYVGEESVGKVTLDAKQSGSLTLTSDSQKYIPPMNPGTTVMVKTVEGKMVLW